MTEEKEGIPQSDKSGEIDSKWKSGIPDRDPDQSWDRTREALKSGKLKSKRALRRSDIDESWRTRPEPGPTASRKPFPTERMKFGPEVQQRRKR